MVNNIESMAKDDSLHNSLSFLVKLFRFSLKEMNLENILNQKTALFWKTANIKMSTKWPRISDVLQMLIFLKEFEKIILCVKRIVNHQFKNVLEKICAQMLA